MINKERFLAITDAIVAVAATIMVLKLDVPDKASLGIIKEQCTVVLAYVISFMQIFLDWHEHHDTFVNADKINHRIFLVNCVWLMAITFVPFATGMVGNSSAHTASLLVYVFILTFEQLVLIKITNMTSKLNNIEIQDNAVIVKTRKVTLTSYALAAITAFLLPQISLPIILVGLAINVVIICRYDRTIS